MKYANVLSSIVFLLISNSIIAQNTILDSTLIYYKKIKINKVKLNINKLNPKSKIIFKKWLKYHDKGQEYLDTINLKYSKNRHHNYLVDLYLGDYYFVQEKKDSIAFNYYLNVFTNAEKSKDTLYLNEALKKLCELQFKLHNLKLLNNYINKFEKYKIDSVDNFYYHYYKIASTLLNNFEYKNKNKPDFKSCEIFTLNNPFLKAKLHKIKGIYYDIFTTNYKRAIEENKKAIIIYSQDSSCFSKSNKNSVLLNTAISYFKLKKYHKTINIHEKLLKTEFKDNIIKKKYLNYWIYKCYDTLNNLDLAFKHLKEYNKLTTELGLEKHAKAIIITAKDLELQQKQIQLEKQINKNKTLKSNMNTILPILFIVIIILGLVFILFKRYYKKSEILEGEKNETIKKIDELKQIVIKNHIVLKDKTKVYIADLMYIKSDDHYLKVFLSNSKNHFVRGTINKIVNELPPNFIRCHRSYIVNRNFIKQIDKTNITLVDKTVIPLSKSYKEKM